MGVIDMVNGKLCEILPIEEIEQIKKEVISETVRTIEEMITNCGSYEFNPEITDYDRGLRDAFETVLEILNKYEEQTE